MIDLTALIESFRNPEWARYAVFAGKAGMACMALVLFSKFSIFGFDKLKAGYGKEARRARNILTIIAVSMIPLIIYFLILASTEKGDNDFLKGKEKTEERLSNPKDEFAPKGFSFYNDDFPIVSIPRKCLPTKFHEFENYTLIAGNFSNDTIALEKTKVMNYFNIRNQGHFTLRCNPEEIYGIEGKYLLFVGRNFTSLPSAKNKKKKYEDIFKKNEYWTDLRIVKFVD